MEAVLHKFMNRPVGALFLGLDEQQKLDVYKELCRSISFVEMR